MQFVIIDSNDEVKGDVHKTLDEAVAEATKLVTDDPDTMVSVAQIVKTVTSTVEIDVEDVK